MSRDRLVQVGATAALGHGVGEERDAAVDGAGERRQRVAADGDRAQADLGVQVASEPLDVDGATQA
jgi:hypothetical protein